MTERTGSNVPTSFTVTRAPFSALPLSAPFVATSQAGTPNIAIGGIDFRPAQGTVTFAAGQTGTPVPFTVVDGCGDFPTFIGGGNVAGF